MTNFKLTALAAILLQIQYNGSNKLSREFVYIHLPQQSELLSFKIITKFKMTALAAILLQIQNGGGDRRSGGFVYIRLQ